MKYIPTIGLEIHAELSTASKMFCSCRNNPDEEKPNVNVCPICLGHPGTLPILNMEAVKNVLKMGIAVGGKLADFTEWDRKNYFYPDIPKGYQISQYKYPLVSGGTLAGVAIERIHLEEDTAQSTHDQHEKSLVNFNRSGVPLMELVTKPVIHDAETAVGFAKELQLLLRYMKAGESNMEKGEMRVEANISVAPEKGQTSRSFGQRSDLETQLGTKTEVKNLNSFRSVERAIACEIARQTSLLDKGGKVVQETRGWDDAKGETYSQRSKESSHDYRYFPDPDIPKMKISEIPEFETELLRKQLPERPWEKRERYSKVFGMTEKETAMFVESPALSEYFEFIIRDYTANKKLVKLTVNYLLTDYLGLLKKSGMADFESIPLDKKIPAKVFTDLIENIGKGDILANGAKKLLEIIHNAMLNAYTINFDQKSVKSLAEEHGYIPNSNAADLAPAIEKILADNASVVAEYKAGKTASLQYLIGQAMKATKGAANPEVVKKLLIEELG